LLSGIRQQHPTIEAVLFREGMAPSVSCASPIIDDGVLGSEDHSLKDLPNQPPIAYLRRQMVKVK
jgi:hypothetical protein